MIHQGAAAAMETMDTMEAEAAARHVTLEGASSSEEGSDEEDESETRVVREQLLNADRLMQASALGEKHEDRAAKIISIAKVVLPHVGLVVILALYTLFGAAVFTAIEQPHERVVRQRRLEDLATTRDFIALRLWNMSRSDQVDFYQFQAQVYHDADYLEEFVWKAFKENIVTLRDMRNETEVQWTFSAAIFFATTVITTIGYGHMAPSTLEGKLFCIAFGLFGIPLLLITIADIGKFLSEFISFLYRASVNATSQIRKSSKKLTQNRRGRRAGQGGGDIDDEVARRFRTAPSSDSSNADEDTIRIPVFIVLLFLVAYTAFGGILFRYWEDWDYFEAFYFCFITMATIGFGDLVPTTQIYMFFTMIYILFGLAITTMCIDLAGTEYIRRIHYFGQKIETAKEAVGEIKKVGGGIVRIAGHSIRTAGGIVVNIRHRRRYSSNNNMNYPIELPRGMSETEFFSLHPELLPKRKLFTNVLFQPLHPEVQRILKPNIKVHPDEITEEDAFVFENKLFDREPRRRQLFRVRVPVHSTTTGASRIPIPSIPSDQLMSASGDSDLLVPFILPESDV